MLNFFLGLAVLAALGNVICTILILADLRRRGQKTNVFLLRIYIYRYLRAYRDATRRETGRPGPLYGLWIQTIVLTGAAVVIAILIRGVR